MRLIAVSHTGLASGAERVLVRVLRAAADDGWDVACLSPAGLLRSSLAEAGIPWLAFPDLKLPEGPRPAAATRLVARWPRAAARLRRASVGADLVLVNGLLALPALRLARLACPAVWLVHDVMVRRDLLAIVRGCAPAVDLAVGVSRAVVEPLAPLGMATRVVYNGTPWPVDPVPREPPARPVVGCNAMLTSWKGQHVLLDAVARIPRPELTVELMGGRFPKDAGYVAELEARASEPDLAGRVRFLGHVDDPLARMRTWSVAVSASIDPEAGPLSLIESMSIGLPAVATAHGGATEIMWEAGLLVPPRDPGSLAVAIEKMLDDSGPWRGAEAPARSLVAARYNLADQLRSLLDTLTEVVQERRAG